MSLKGVPFFCPTCPKWDCGWKNHPSHKYCSECGERLYPTQRQLAKTLKEHAA